eukprot:50890-Chlamydomonas_euryale.AAC.1
MHAHFHACGRPPASVLVQRKRVVACVPRGATHPCPLADLRRTYVTLGRPANCAAAHGCCTYTHGMYCCVPPTVVPQLLSSV